jgi:hypothetical protein
MIAINTVIQHTERRSQDLPFAPGWDQKLVLFVGAIVGDLGILLENINERSIFTYKFRRKTAAIEIAMLQEPSRDEILIHPNATSCQELGHFCPTWPDKTVPAIGKGAIAVGFLEARERSPYFDPGILDASLQIQNDVLTKSVTSRAEHFLIGLINEMVMFLHQVRGESAVVALYYGDDGIEGFSSHAVTVTIEERDAWGCIGEVPHPRYRSARTTDPVDQANQNILMQVDLRNLFQPRI